MWLGGILLLLSTAAGAGWVLNHSHDGNGYAAQDQTPAVPPDAILAIGRVDVEGDVRKISPPPGRVEWIAPEGAHVKKGDVIVKIDNRYLNSAVDLARCALADAETLLKKARAGCENNKIDVQMQENVVRLKTAKKEAARLEYEEAIKKDLKTVLPNQFAILGWTLKALEGEVAVEKDKLHKLKLPFPAIDLEQARNNVAAKKVDLDKALLALEECDVRAPTDGAVLRVFISPGEHFVKEMKWAMQFCPDARRVVRAEVLQEWAGLVKEGQDVTIEDDTVAGTRWHGKVQRVSNWIAPKREVMLEPFMVNDVRTLECLIDVRPGGPPLRLGQRVRVMILQGKS
jgi:multidrug resistance efflux pump